MAIKADKNMADSKRPFWREKSLAEMNDREWESLCDGCGKCCLNKLEDWDTGEIHFTNVACTLFNGTTCRCNDYENRFETVPDCTKLTPRTVGSFSWLPRTCAYRILEEGGDLPSWHPLVTGNAASVHDAGVSVTGRTVPEDGMSPEDWEDYVVDWVDEIPENSSNSKR